MKKFLSVALTVALLAASLTSCTIHITNKNKKKDYDTVSSYDFDYDSSFDDDSSDDEVSSSY